MDIKPSDTESVVRNHLQAFLEQKGIAAILSDYDDDARFLSEGRTYHGRREIGDFFEAFIASLPPQAIKPLLTAKPARRGRRGVHHLERRPRDAPRYGYFRRAQRKDRFADFRDVRSAGAHSGSRDCRLDRIARLAVSRCGAHQSKDSAMGAFLSFLYGLVAYGACLAALLYLIGFSGNVLVPKISR